MEILFLKIPIGAGGVLLAGGDLDGFVGSFGGCFTFTDCICGLTCVTCGVVIL